MAYFKLSPEEETATLRAEERVLQGIVNPKDLELGKVWLVQEYHKAEKNKGWHWKKQSGIMAGKGLKDARSLGFILKAILIKGFISKEVHDTFLNNHFSYNMKNLGKKSKYKKTS